MSKINNKQVEKVAELAKIKISLKQKEKYTEDLSKILDYVEVFEKVDTKDVKETSQVTGLVNVYRNDEVMNEWKVSDKVDENTEKLLSNAKARKGDFIKVKQVLN